MSGFCPNHGPYDGPSCPFPPPHGDRSKPENPRLLLNDEKSETGGVCPNHGPYDEPSCPFPPPHGGRSKPKNPRLLLNDEKSETGGFCPNHGPYDGPSCPFPPPHGGRSKPKNPRLLLNDEKSETGGLCPNHGPYDGSSCPYPPPHGDGVPIYLDDEDPTDLDLPLKLLPSFPIRFPLKPNFRFVHEPQKFFSDDLPMPYVGRDALVDKFVSRLNLSDGGALLVTGFRGVGKTSFVNRTIFRFKEKIKKNTEQNPQIVIDITVNLARKISIMGLMHLLIRRLYDRLDELGILNVLEKGLIEKLRLSYQRTSYAIARKQSQSMTGEIKTGLTIPLLPTFSTSKQTFIETSFLSYDENTAEADLIDIGQLLAKKATKNQSWFFSLFSKKRPQIKVIFIFDEMDKLEENEDSSMVTEILTSLKTLFTTSGLTFIFVAGNQLHNRWKREIKEGDSVLESVFADEIYIPALWDDADKIALGIIDRKKISEQTAPNSEDEILENFIGYLKYKGRGLPRLLIRTINEFVSFDKNVSYLDFQARGWGGLQIYHRLNQAIESEQIFNVRNYIAEAQPDVKDSIRFGTYYLIDWILSRGRMSFTLSDSRQALEKMINKSVLAQQEGFNIAPNTIKALQKHDFIKELGENLEEALIDIPDESAQRRYILSSQTFFRISSVQKSEISNDPYVESWNKISKDNFSYDGLIGTGGMANIFKAHISPGNYVAIKTIRDEYLERNDVRRLFTNEANILQHLSMGGHKNVVKIITSNTTLDYPYIVLDYIEGPTLDLLLKGGLPEINVVVAIVLEVAIGLSYIHSKNVIRCDIKPANIILGTNGIPTIIDFGTAKIVGEVANSEFEPKGSIIGTPHYMSPEQILGQEVNATTDIYSIGILFYKLLTGQVPYAQQSVQELRFAYANLVVPNPTSIRQDIPIKLAEIVLKCLEKNPNMRFQSANDLIKVLLAFIDTTKPVDLAEIAKPTLRMRPIEPEHWEIMQTDLEPIKSPLKDDVPQLIIQSGKSAGKVFSLVQENKIGRSREANVLLIDRGISRLHTSLSYNQESGLYIIRDLNSISGTYVNDEKIITSKPLSDHDIIKIGNIKIEFRLGNF